MIGGHGSVVIGGVMRVTAENLVMCRYLNIYGARRAGKSSKMTYRSFPNEAHMRRLEVHPVRRPAKQSHYSRMAGRDPGRLAPGALVFPVLVPDEARDRKAVVARATFPPIASQEPGAIRTHVFGFAGRCLKPTQPQAPIHTRPARAGHAGRRVFG